MTKLKPRNITECLTEKQQDELCQYLLNNLVPDTSTAVHYGTQFSGPDTGVFFFQAVYNDIEAYEEGAKIISHCTSQFLREHNLQPYQVIERTLWQLHGSVKH